MSDLSTEAGTMSRIVCQWCQSQNESLATACRSCGAPLDVRNLVTASGWREAPQIKDMTEIKFDKAPARWKAPLFPWPRSTSAATIRCTLSTM